MKCLHHAYEWAYYFWLTLVWLFHECFACLLPSLEYFNSLLLTFIAGACSEIPCSIGSRFAETSYLNFIAIQLTGLPHDAEYGCVESRKRLLTVLYLFFLCLLVLYFHVAPSRVFFEYVSCKLFRWYLLILIGLLTCI